MPVSLDPEDSLGDLPVSIFIFGGKMAPPEDGIYFIHAWVITTTVNEETSLELYCIDICCLQSFCLLISVNVCTGHAIN